MLLSNKMFNYSVASLLFFLTIFIFPLNLLYVHLITKAYVNDKTNLLKSFMHETIVLYTFLKTHVLNLYNEIMDKFNNLAKKQPMDDDELESNNKLDPNNLKTKNEHSEPNIYPNLDKETIATNHDDSNQDETNQDENMQDENSKKNN